MVTRDVNRLDMLRVLALAVSEAGSSAAGAGRTIDVATEGKYSLHLPAHSTSPFKLSFRREFAETNYAQHIVRVLSAKDARDRW